MKISKSKLVVLLVCIVSSIVLPACDGDLQRGPGFISADHEFRWRTVYGDPWNNEDGPGHNNVNHVVIPLNWGAPAEVTVLSGDTLWVASHEGGLRAVDLSDPANPRHLGYSPLPGPPVKMHVTDGRIDVLCRTHETFEWDGPSRLDHRMRILFFDVSDPVAIRRLGEVTSEGLIRDFRRDGQVLWLVETEGGVPITTIVSRWNVADPGRPSPEGNLAWVDDIAVLTEPVTPVLFDGSGVWLQDCPGVLRQVSLDDPSGLPVTAAEVALSHEDARIFWMEMQDNHLWILSSHGQLTLDIFPISGGRPGQRLASLDIPVSGSVSDPRILREGTRLGIIPNREEGSSVVVLELADPAVPALWAIVMNSARDLALVGDALLLDADGRLLHYDIATLGSPVLCDLPQGNLTGATKAGALVHLAPGLLATVLHQPSSGAPGAVALFSFDDQVLTFRGTLDFAGYPGSALLHAGRLVVVGAARLESWDIAAPDHPTGRTEVALARNVAAAAVLEDGRLAQVVVDEFSASIRLELVADADAYREGEAPQGSLELAVPGFFPQTGTFALQGLFPVWTTRLFPLDGGLVLISSFPGTATGWDFHLWRFDVSDLVRPTLAATLDLPFRIDPPAGNSGELSQARNVFQAGGTLATHHLWDDPDLHVVDLAAAAPEGGFWSGQSRAVQDDRHSRPHLFMREELLLIARSEIVSDVPATVAWRLDRLDLRDPAHPRWLPSVSTPGKVLDWDPATGRVILADAQWAEGAPDPEFGCSYFRPFLDYRSQDQNCRIITFTLKAGLLTGGRVAVTGTVQMDGPVREARIVGDLVIVDHLIPRWLVEDEFTALIYTPITGLQGFSWSGDGTIAHLWGMGFEYEGDTPRLAEVAGSGALVLGTDGAWLFNPSRRETVASVVLPGSCPQPLSTAEGFVCALGGFGLLQLRR